MIKKFTVERLCQFLWRPRPATLLNEEKIKEIRKNLKKYAKDFDAKDRLAFSKLSKEIIEKRQTQSREFKEILERNRKLRDGLLERIQLLRENVDESMDEYDEEYEFFIKEDVFPLDDN